MTLLRGRVTATGILFSILCSGSPVADEATTIEGVESGTDVSGTLEPVSQTVGTATRVETDLSQQYAEFLGSEEQAAQVVDGLRQGTAFGFSPDAGTGTGDTVQGATIEPPTGSMGYGNVKITLGLAERQLQQMGITQPSSEELSAVLLGGDINGQAVNGILAMRADGMGWGEIARQYDMTVGQIMGKAHTAAATGSAATQSTSSTSTGMGNGYIPSSASGTAPGLVKHQSNGYISSSRGQHGNGVVSANGATVQQATYPKSNGKTHAIKANNSYAHGNKHGYIASGNAGGGAGATSMATAAATPGSMGKAKGHVNKKQ